MLFETTIELLSTAENSLLMRKVIKKREEQAIKDKVYNKFLLSMQSISLPLFLFFEGFQLYMRNIKNFLFLLILSLIIVYLINSDKNTIEILLLFVLIVSFFPLPSTYCNYGVTKEHVTLVKSILKEFKINKDDIKDIDSYFKDYQQKIKQKIFGLKGTIVFIWTIYIFFLNKTFIITSGHVMKNDFSIPLGYLVGILLMLYIIVESYSKGVWLILKSLDFGLIEYKKDLDKEKEIKMEVMI